MVVVVVVGCSWMGRPGPLLAGRVGWLVPLGRVGLRGLLVFRVQLVA
jgi:hypothetical protein